MTGPPPLCPSCTQPGTLADEGWHCRNEACPEFGQQLRGVEPPPAEPPNPGRPSGD